jgi:translation elongation factor TU
MNHPIVVGTAGHIDHGKTSLIRALTGVDLDRLPEEQRRGITIQLGFCPLDLPDGRRVAFVDVPGHEGLVRTMIAGAQGVDAALLCVSAVDGVMPQTREHLAILDLLGVQDGAIVLTKADLVDEELLELAKDDVLAVVRGTCLEGRPIVPFSAITGAGRDELLAVLSALQARTRPEGGPFRLPVDRAFSRAGFGTVVTGTSAGGRVRVGDAVRLLPEGRAARVRGLEVHGAQVDAVGPGLRVAMNLGGVETEEVPRGTVVAAGEVAVSSILDLAYRHTNDETELADGVPVRVLTGTGEVIGKAWLGGREPMLAGEAGFVQVRLDEPLACLPGDAVVLRRPSPASTLGGGAVLDPWAQRVRPRDGALWAEQLRRLQAGDEEVLLERAGPEGVPDTAWSARGLPAVGVLLGERRVATATVAALEAALTEQLAAFHRSQPLAAGVARPALHRGLLKAVGDKALAALVARCPGGGGGARPRTPRHPRGRAHAGAGGAARAAAGAGGDCGSTWGGLGHAQGPPPRPRGRGPGGAAAERRARGPRPRRGPHRAARALDALRAWLREHFAQRRPGSRRPRCGSGGSCRARR